VIALLQRVSSASVEVEQQKIAAISFGMLAFIGVRPEDTMDSGSKLLDRMLKYRIFGDDARKMNLSLSDIEGSLLLVPQFTLAADTRKGLRPGFSAAASPAHARLLFDNLVDEARLRHPMVETGRFGADMRVALVNDGPVTLWLES